MRECICLFINMRISDDCITKITIGLSVRIDYKNGFGFISIENSQKLTICNCKRLKTIQVEREALVTTFVKDCPKLELLVLSNDRISVENCPALIAIDTNISIDLSNFGDIDELIMNGSASFLNNKHVGNLIACSCKSWLDEQVTGNALYIDSYSLRNAPALRFGITYIEEDNINVVDLRKLVSVWVKIKSKPPQVVLNNLNTLALALDTTPFLFTYIGRNCCVCFNGSIFSLLPNLLLATFLK